MRAQCPATGTERANPMDRLQEKIAILVELNAAKDQALAAQGSLLTMAEEHAVRRKWNT